MKTKTGLLLAVLLATQALPVFAQYHYSYGDARVTNQNNVGLQDPSGSYIGSGTLSQSAQGKGAGVGGLLPSVNMGAHVRTPGDNMYNGAGTDRMNNGALIYQDQKNVILSRKAAILRRRQMQSMQQQQTQRTGYVYMPGSNGASASYASQPASQIQINSNGNATYGDNYKAKSSTRNF